jgi:rSAM/selenodomain-associated transferase 2
MISVVIPTLNAEADLAAALDALSPVDHPLIGEIIVSDGGSSDSTIEIAARADCRVIQGPPGRGAQLHSGALLARGRWLLFVHADTCLSTGWEQAASEFLKSPASKRRAAVFIFELDDRRKRARCLERIVAIRVRALGLPYGDQGLLLARSFYEEVGGYRPFPLMEDVDLVRRIGRCRIETLAVSAVTSADRYRRNGYVRRSVRNAACLLLYFLGVPPQRIAKFYA